MFGIQQLYWRFLFYFMQYGNGNKEIGLKQKRTA